MEDGVVEKILYYFYCKERNIQPEICPSIFNRFNGNDPSKFNSLVYNQSSAATTTQTAPLTHRYFSLPRILIEKSNSSGRNNQSNTAIIHFILMSLHKSPLLHPLSVYSLYLFRVVS